MRPSDFLTQAAGLIVPGRVYSEPITSDGTTIIPAAIVRGVGGGGGGEEGHHKHGEGCGFIISARPVGALEIRDGNVCWRPTIDANRVIAGLVIVAVAVSGFRWLTERARARSTAEITRLEHPRAEPTAPHHTGSEEA